MSRVQILLIFAFAIIFTANSAQQCPPNQEWNDCGTACPLTCEDQSPRACTKQCVMGCQCKQGYVRNDNGGCVLPRNC